MFELKFDAELADVAVSSQELTATLKVELQVGLIDQLLDFLDKDLHFIFAETGRPFYGVITNLRLHKNRTCSAFVKIKRTEGLVDRLLDAEDNAYAFVMEVDHVQPALPQDESEDDARPPADVLDQAEREEYPEGDTAEGARYEAATDYARP